MEYSDLANALAGLVHMHKWSEKVEHIPGNAIMSGRVRLTQICQCGAIRVGQMHEFPTDPPIEARMKTLRFWAKNGMYV